MANDRGVSSQLGCALAAGAMIVIADMTGTGLCDSTGLRTLALAHEQAAAHHTELRLVITSVNVLHVLAGTKLDTVLRIYPSLDAAQAAALPGRHIVPGQRGSPVIPSRSVVPGRLAIDRPLAQLAPSMHCRRIAYVGSMPIAVKAAEIRAHAGRAGLCGRLPAKRAAVD